MQRIINSCINILCMLFLVCGVLRCVCILCITMCMLKYNACAGMCAVASYFMFVAIFLFFFVYIGILPSTVGFISVFVVLCSICYVCYIVGDVFTDVLWLLQ